ncbi:hypothetical protein PRIPAC_82518 [Pristionchus pacificus]|uniref:Uncharacterized protein n=1 Tax=Pristionchus pacificus TaxID=54126 RepID=A0A2A6BWY8_PRIPA|nr:hypothetical protein PRIPAC_82518 [Pristionchus pacificus]|eukprot:PDM70415.1 hypothetical protein PRIPAC_46661 [Pristionchus pacificus]
MDTRRLLDERAGVTVSNSLGNTPAQVCSLNGHSALAAMLFEKEDTIISAPIRSRNESKRNHVLHHDPDELVLPSLVSFTADLTPLMTPQSPGTADSGGGRLSLSSGLGGTLSSGKGTLSGSVDALLSTPTPKLPHILTPPSQQVEISLERLDTTPSTFPRKRHLASTADTARPEMFIVEEKPDPAVLGGEEQERWGRYVVPSLRRDARGDQMDNGRRKLMKLIPIDYIVQIINVIDTDVDRVGALNILYVTTGDYRWNLLKMNSAEDIDNILTARLPLDETIARNFIELKV